MKNYDEMVRQIACGARSCLNYGENYIINVSYYDNDEMTITIYEKDTEAPHYRAYDLDAFGHIVQRWYKNEKEDDWLFFE